MLLLWTAQTFALFAILAVAQNNTIITLYDGTNCSPDASQYAWEPSAQEATSDGGNCIERLPATALSLMFSQFQPGCSATVYSDVYCTDNAILAEINTCTDLGNNLRIRSLSIDGCDVEFSESGNATNSTTSSTESTTHDTLSTAAKAGIGAGIGCGVLLLAAIGLAFWIKRRRSRVNRAAPDNSQGQTDLPNELSGAEIFELGSPRGLEMPAEKEKEKQEMEAKPVIAELRSKSSVRIVLPQELEGDQPQT